MSGPRDIPSSKHEPQHCNYFAQLQFHSFGPKSFLLCAWIYSIKKKKNLSFPPIVGNPSLSAPFSLWWVHFSSSSGLRCALPLGMENCFPSSGLHLRPFSLDMSFSSLCFCFFSHKCDKLCRKLRLLQEKFNGHRVKTMRKGRCENHYS